MKNQFNWPLFIALVLLILHICIIAQDVQQVIQDPNQADKPREILKLAVDLNRYFG